MLTKSKRFFVFSLKTEIFIADIIDSNNKSTFISTVNANNVNQLGDISIVTDNIPDYGSEIKSIVDEFNRINNNSISGFYSKDAASNNTYLLQLWNDINKLMNTVNGKLTKMDPFSGSVTLKKNITRTINAYDVSYEDHLHQFSSWYSSPGVGYDYGRFSNDQLIQQSKNLLVPRFNQWFLNGSAEDGSGARISKLYDYGHHGTGLWYKNFHNKVNLNTGNLSSNRNPSWDLFEAVPLIGQQNGSGSGENKFFNPNYYWGVTNNFCFYVGNGNDSSFSTRLSGTGYYGGARYSSSQHDPIPSGWSGDTTDAYMNSISYIGNDPLQRNPRYTYGNSNLVIGGTNYHTFSPVQATVPVTSYINWYYSNTGLYNKDKITFRCGLYKRVNQTVITTSHMNWNDSSNKWG